MILSASDLVIFATLLLNALALVSGSGKGLPTGRDRYMNSGAGQERDEASRGLLGDEDEDEHSSAPAPSTSTSGSQPLSLALTSTAVWNSRSPLAQHLQRAALAVRRYSCILIGWNVSFLCLMVFVFRE